jgi:hypothetical protein
MEKNAGKERKLMDKGDSVDAGELPPPASAPPAGQVVAGVQTTQGGVSGSVQTQGGESSAPAQGAAQTQGVSLQLAVPGVHAGGSAQAGQTQPGTAPVQQQPGTAPVQQQPQQQLPAQPRLAVQTALPRELTTELLKRMRTLFEEVVTAYQQAVKPIARTFHSNMNECMAKVTDAKRTKDITRDMTALNEALGKDDSTQALVKLQAKEKALRKKITGKNFKELNDCVGGLEKAAQKPVVPPTPKISPNPPNSERETKPDTRTVAPTTLPLANVQAQPVDDSDDSVVNVQAQPVASSVHVGDRVVVEHTKLEQHTGPGDIYRTVVDDSQPNGEAVVTDVRRAGPPSGKLEYHLVFDGSNQKAVVDGFWLKEILRFAEQGLSVKAGPDELSGVVLRFNYVTKRYLVRLESGKHEEFSSGSLQVDPTPVGSVVQMKAGQDFNAELGVIVAVRHDGNAKQDKYDVRVKGAVLKDVSHQKFQMRREVHNGPRVKLVNFENNEQHYNGKLGQIKEFGPHRRSGYQYLVDMGGDRKWVRANNIQIVEMPASSRPAPSVGSAMAAEEGLSVIVGRGQAGLVKYFNPSSNKYVVFRQKKGKLVGKPIDVAAATLKLNPVAVGCSVMLEDNSQGFIVKEVGDKYIVLVPGQGERELTRAEFRVNKEVVNGPYVRLTGLKGKKQNKLNGKTGQITAFDPFTKFKFYSVVVEGSTFNVRAENMELVQAPVAAPAPGAASLAAPGASLAAPGAASPAAPGAAAASPAEEEEHWNYDWRTTDGWESYGDVRDNNAALQIQRRFRGMRARRAVAAPGAAAASPAEEDASEQGVDFWETAAGAY